MATEQAWHQGVEGGDGHRQKPEGEQASAIPRLDRSLRGGLNRLPGQQKVRCAVDPGEPAEGGDKEPLGDLGALVGAAVELEHRPDADEQEGEEQHRRGPVRVLQPFHPGAVTGEDRKRAEQDGDVPEDRGADQQRGVQNPPERPSAEAGHQPDAGGKGGLGSPSVEEEIPRHRREAAVGEETDAAEESGGDQLHREDEGDQRGDDQPVDGIAEKNQHRKAHGGINGARLGRSAILLGVMMGKDVLAHCWEGLAAVFSVGRTSSIARVIGIRATPLALSFHP